jgi:hypothetical protein
MRLSRCWSNVKSRKKGCRIISAAGEGTENDDPAAVFTRRIPDAVSEARKKSDCRADERRCGKPGSAGSHEQEVLREIRQLRAKGGHALSDIAAMLNRADLTNGEAGSGDANSSRNFSSGTATAVCPECGDDRLRHSVATAATYTTMDMNRLIYGRHVLWSQNLGNYEMACTVEERPDGSWVVIVKENGAEIERAEFPAPEHGDLAGAIAATNHAMQLQQKFFSRAMQGMSSEFSRLRPR